MSLKGQAARRFGVVGLTAATARLDQRTDLCRQDAELTWRLHQELSPQTSTMPVYEIERRLAPILAHMTLFGGFYIDKPGLRRWGDELRQTTAILEANIVDAVGHPINVRSNDQIGAYLFDERGLPSLKRTAGGSRSVGADVLRSLSLYDVVPQLLLMYRTMTKRLTTYVEPYLNNTADRLTCIWNQTGARSGRVSSEAPNMTNIPDDVATYLMAPDGYKIVSIDLSQIEYRVAAHLSQDPSMLAAYREDRDLHDETRVRMGLPIEMRRLAKIVNFASLYGGGADKIVEAGQKEGVTITDSDATEFQRRLRIAYPQYFEWGHRMSALAVHNHWNDGMFGRRHHYTTPATMEERLHVERQGVNLPIQGAAADIAKQLIVFCWEAFGHVVVNYVHDAVYMIVPDRVASEVANTLANETMNRLNGWAGLDIPILGVVHVQQRFGGNE